MFPMRGGTGLMGEAGPEAIMPLARGPDGRLGVMAAGGGRAVSVVMNITTPDVDGFRRSQSQIAAQMNRALARGQRNG
jgi:phage-related minor tail protein